MVTTEAKTAFANYHIINNDHDSWATTCLPDFPDLPDYLREFSQVSLS